MNHKFLKTLSWLVPALGLAIFSCKESFLNEPQKGNLSDNLVASKKGAEQALIGAYSDLKSNAGSWQGSHTNWVYGSIAGGDAHKGSDAGDQADINPIASFSATPTNDYFNAKWRAIYDGVHRANAAIRIATKLTDSEISADDKKRIIGEARFLRGFYNLEGTKMFGKIPYIDETMGYVEGNYKVPNTKLIWPEIEADFKFAMDNLKGSGMEIGRANKYSAEAFLAKVYLFQLKYTEAKSLLDDIITNGTNPAGKKFDLNPRFWDNYDASQDNNVETVFAIQSSANDGSGGQNANWDNILNFPYNNGPGGCCGFFQPSFDLVNSYRTNAEGLPLLDASYNVGSDQVATDQGLAVGDDFAPDKGSLDPRLDWTAGRRGLPYYDWGIHPGASWIRLQANGGPFSPKKNTYPKAYEGKYTDGSSWTKGLTSTNFNLIRFADVLLMAAEAEVEAGDLEKARAYVNRVRNRAANKEGFVKVDPAVSLSDAKKGEKDWAAYVNKTGVAAANYNIQPYPAANWTKDMARKAVHFERKLELAMEGHRFFDLVRWGETVGANPNGNPVNLQAYLDYEGSKLSIYKGVKFVPGKNEVYPIPQRQIDLTGADILKQNPKY